MSKLESLGIPPIVTRQDFMQVLAAGNFRYLSPDDIEQIVPWDLDKYTLSDFRRYFDRFVQLFGGNWNIFAHHFASLDIACGGIDSEGFYPWMPVILAYLGASATGIDVGHQPAELAGIYQHYEYDLANLSDNGLFDIPGIATNGGFNLITFLSTITPSFGSSDVMRSTSKIRGMNMEHIETNILNHVEDLLLPGGILFMDSRQGWQQAFKKEGDELIAV